MSDSVTLGENPSPFLIQLLKSRWSGLKKALSTDNEVLQMGEWKELDEMITEGETRQAVNDPELPPRFGGTFPDDPQSVRKAEVTRSYLNKRLWGINVLSASGRPGDNANLWVGVKTLVKIGWTVYVKPNPSASEEGYVLHGEYNRYGDRLK